MSLDNIQLPPQMVAGLYNKSLILLDNHASTKEPSPEVTFNFLGKNAKRILVLVSVTDSTFLADADLDFLTKMLDACQLSLADIVLVNLGATKVHYQQLIDQFSPECFLLFSIAPADIELPIHFPNFQLQKYNNCSFVTAPALQILASSIAEKKLFWTVLKTLFQLS